MIFLRGIESDINVIRHIDENQLLIAVWHGVVSGKIFDDTQRGFGCFLGRSVAPDVAGRIFKFY
ncbi:MAG: hypothetical protein HQM14_16940 [SAR324 cluster bacterium]|nr:hypothetical protein [SAR324 cluster bacterium]